MGYFDNQTSCLGFIQSKILSDLLNEYFECLKLEDQPEKGERRISDDFIIVIEEIFRDCTTDDPEFVPNGVKLFRIGLLEYWLSQSIYNFDVSLQLNRLYQDLNMNKLFLDKLKYLELKGIQMEALGYIAIKQFMLNNDSDGLNFWYTKYLTFLQRNGKDTNHLKAKAMQSQNYEKVDEFYQYQMTIEKSYFSQIVKCLKHSYQVKEKISNDTWISDFCTGLASKEFEYSDDQFDSLAEEIMAKSFIRTQNVEVWATKYATIPKVSEVVQKWRTDDHYTNSPGDAIFSYLKFSSRNNYKPGMVNSLAFFEHPLIFQIYKGLFTLSGLTGSKSDNSEKLTKVLDSVSQKLDIFEKFLEAEKDRDDFKNEYKMIKYLMQLFRAWHSITALTAMLLPMKEFKSETEKLNQSLEDNKSLISEHTETITSVFGNNEVWKSENESEEVKMDHSDISQVNKFFTFEHTQEGLKLITFLSNYVLPMLSVALSSLNQTVSSMGPKKKKKNFAESALAKVLHQPCKDATKVFKNWIKEKIELYSDKDQHSRYSTYIEQVQEHSNEYFGQVEALKSCDSDGLADSFKDYVSKAVGDLLVEPISMVTSLKNIKIQAIV